MIRQATLDDVQELATLFDLYRQFYKQESDLHAAASFLKERILNNESVVFIAEDEISKRIIGFTQLYPGFSSIGLKRSWILNDLYVKNENRKQGMAEKLLIEATAFSRKSGARSIMLQTALANSPAQRLYEKLGWEKDSEFLTYYIFHD